MSSNRVATKLIMNDELIPYLFFREDGFYQLGLSGDAVAIENAMHNPGTLRVENAITRVVVWSSN